LASDDLGKLLQRVQWGEFPPPRQIARNVPRALEAVCLKAMALRPEDRYASPRALADDIERWLADEPVTAYCEPLRLRLARWRRRHATAVAVAAVVLLLVSVGGLWLKWDLDARDAEAARLAEATEGAVESALQETTRLLNEARWAEARAAVARAQGRLGDGGPADLRQRLRQARADLELVRELENIRLQQAVQVRDDAFDRRPAAPASALAFQKYGLDVQSLEPKVAAARIVGSAIRVQIIAALDDWLFVLRDEARTKHQRLLEIVTLADDDDARRRIRAESQNKAALERLARRPETLAQPPATLVLLSRKLVRADAPAVAVDLLRRGQQLHPGDFWINHELAFDLMHLKPARTDEAIGFYRAALAVNPSSPGLYVNLGHALASQGKHAEDEAACRQAIALQPDYAMAHHNLGHALASQGKHAEAEAAFRKAIALQPDDARAHNNLGSALGSQGKHTEAEAACRQAIALQPDHARAHYNLGLALAGQGKYAEAEAASRKAIALQPDDAAAHVSLGIALHRQGRDPEAAAAHRQAITLQPENAQAHYNLGSALYREGKHAEAEAAYRQTIALQPENAEAFCNLADALRQQGRFADSLAAYRRGHELGSKNPGWSNPTAQWVRSAEHLVTIERKLPAVLRGEVQPADAGERTTLAYICQRQNRQLHAAARLYAEAFAAQPGLATNLQLNHRYNAARAATLAGCGQGEDAAKLDDKERACWRRQALDWLRANLALWTKQVESGSPKARSVARKALRHWLADVDFAGVREAAALADLPEDERAAWQQFWADVAAVLKKAGPPDKSVK
jgi:tetratricopeptide (TPR) repeat protein